MFVVWLIGVGELGYQTTHILAGVSHSHTNGVGACTHTHTHTHTWLVRTGLIACCCVQVISSRYLVEGECPTVHIPVVKTVGKVTWLARNENWVLLWILDGVLKGCAQWRTIVTSTYSKKAAAGVLIIVLSGVCTQACRLKNKSMRSTVVPTGTTPKPCYFPTGVHH